MPFETRSTIEKIKLADLDTTDDAVVVVKDEDDGAEVLAVVNDSDLMLLVKDRPSSTDDILFLRDNADGVLVVQDHVPAPPDLPAFFTESQDITLVDAGPVFQGPQGGKGDPGAPGLDLYHTWKILFRNQNPKRLDQWCYYRSR